MREEKIQSMLLCFYGFYENSEEDRVDVFDVRGVSIFWTLDLTNA